MLPDVSIVLPTHNGGRFIDESIKSVIAQTFSDWELIIVDDASTDNTSSKINRWTAIDPRIRTITLPSNQGLPRALNEGFRHAMGRFFTWTSDDNAYRSQALTRMVDALKSNSSVGIVYAAYSFVDDKGSLIAAVPAAVPSELAYGNCINGCFLYRKQVHEVLGGYREEHKLVEDWDFWLRAAMSYQLQPIHEDLYLYRRHTDSLTARKSLEIERAIGKLLADSLPTAKWINGRSLARGYKRIADSFLISGDYPGARHYLLKSFLISPFCCTSEMFRQGRRKLYLEALLHPLREKLVHQDQ